MDGPEYFMKEVQEDITGNDFTYMKSKNETNIAKQKQTHKYRALVVWRKWDGEVGKTCEEIKKYRLPAIKSMS